MMDVDPAAIVSLVERMDEDTVEEIEQDLHDLCCFAWPTLDAQNN